MGIEMDDENAKHEADEVTYGKLELADLKEMEAMGRALWDTIHDEGKEDTRYANGDHWGNMAAKRQQNGRPSFTYNVAPAFLRVLTGAVRQAPPAGKISPVSSGTLEGAKKRAGLIRHIEDKSHAHRARLHALESAAKGGIGAVRILPKKMRNGDVELRVIPIYDTSRLILAPNANPLLLEDADWIGYSEVITGRQFCKDFPEHEFPVDDKDLVTVREMWTVEDEKVIQYLYNDNELLHVDLDYPGKFIPFSVMTGEFRYIDEKWHFAGMIRDIKEPLNEIDYLRTEAIDFISRMPKANFMGEEDAVEGHEAEWSRSNVEAISILRYKKGAKIDQIRAGETPVAFFEAAQQAYQVITQIVGVNPAQGMMLDPASGKSVKLQQAQSQVATYYLVQALNDAVVRETEILLDLLPHYYNDGRQRQILGEDGSVSSAKFGADGEDSEDLFQGEYGVTISTGVSYGSQREALIDSLLEIARNNPQYAPVVMAMTLRLMSIPGSEDISDMWTVLLPPQLQQYLANKGDSSAQMALMGQQTDELKQALQKITAELHEVVQKYQEAQAQLADKSEAETIKAQSAIQLEEVKHTNEMEKMSAGHVHKIIETEHSHDKTAESRQPTGNGASLTERMENV